MKKVLLTALALLMGTFMYAQRDAAKIPGVTPSKDVKTEAVLSAVKAPANTNSARTTKGDSELTYCTGEFSSSIDRSGYGFPFAESFENGLTAWGNIDADGDGHLWELAAGHDGMGAKSVSWESVSKGSDAARRDNAAQKENGRGSYDPNNWLISPEITIPSTAGQEGPVQLSWYVQSGSTSYREHYGVYVSTTGDQPADFTTQVYEGQSPNTAGWTQLTVDLSAYIGQTIRVAFRHYDSYDKWHFVIDDVEVYEYVEPAPVVCDPITTFPYVNDFENFLDEKDCWIDIDNDGDGYGWFTDTQAYGTYGFGVEGSNCLISQSYDNNIGSRDADNYLLSPEVVFPANSTITLSWYEQSVDGNYPDSYEVMIAPNGSTEISDFVSIYSGVAANPWTERTADISAYAGTTVRVVFHHQSYDCYILGIDNMSITVEGGEDPSGELTIYADATDTQRYAPVYTYYGDTQNSAAQFVVPASQLTDMVGGEITSMKFYTNPAQHYNIQNISGPTYVGYMTEVDSETLSTFIDFNSATNIFNGNISLTDDCLIIDLATPYTYNGGNLAIAFLCTNAGSYCSTYYYSAAVTGGSIYRNSATTTPNVTNYLPKTTFTYISPESTGLTVTPTDLGTRPNGAWMEPATVEVKGGVYNVTAVDMDNDYFTVEGQTVPFTTPVTMTIATGDAAATGQVTGNLSFFYNGSKDIATFAITADAYDPTAGDVVETATVVANPVGYTNTPTGIYHNYNLPGEASDGADAVYKLTFASDVMLDANVGAAANGKVALYPEGFNGEGGPMATNAYEYNGPQVGPGPKNIWFSYPYTGSNTFYGSSTSGMIFGYELSAEVIAAEGLAGLTLTEVESAAREAYPYDLLIMTGVSGPENIVYYQPMGTAAEAMYFFNLPLSEPYVLGEENTWIMFMTDSPYSAYCGITPVDAANAKIWYSMDLASWYTSTTYTPEIYCHFLELPTGREMSMNLASMTVKANYAGGTMAEMTAEVNGMSKAAKNNSRSGSSSFTEGFENGLNGWTNIDADGDGHVWMDCMDYGCYAIDYAHTGSHSVVSASYDLCGNYGYEAFNANNYLVSPQKYTIAEGSKLSFWYDDADVMYGWPDYFEVCVSTAGNTSASDFTAVWSNGNKSNGAKDGRGTRSYGTWRQVEVDLSAYAGQEVYIAFHHQNYDGYDLWIDDVELKVNEPAPGMFVPAGTYYLVAQATEAFTTSINVTAAPAPEQAVVVSPYDGETYVESPYLAEWILGDYTTEMQVLFGTQYPPQIALIDWTSELVESAFLMDLEPNQSYFLQVNERNVAGTTEGEIIAFTTPIDPVEGLEIAESNLYPGDAAVLTWTANARTLKGYNVYVDGVKWNESLINTNSYDVEGLEYNMAGYDIQVSAVYDAGESELSEAVTAYMTGYGSVSGHAYDKPDEDTDAMPIAFATVMFSGLDEYDVNQTFVVETDEEGAFAGEILAGTYTASVITEGYDSNIAVNASVNYNNLTDNIDIYTHEFYYPVGMVTATEEGDEVLVEWSWDPAELMIDFETGDFSQAEFTLPASYPWEITTTNPYEGTYCMKSTCEGVASGISAIEVTVDVPYDGLMGFWVKVSSEQNYDKFHFYIDGVEMGSGLSGQAEYAYKEYAVTEGTHTYKWEYAKDSSVNSNDDCIYVDNVTLYKQAGPAPSGMTYNFDDGTMMGWTTIDANNDGYDWVLGSQIGGVYLVAGASLAGSGHNSSADLVCSGSFSNASGVAITPDNYLVSPTKISAQDGAAINFWACAQDASYAAEHFGVAVSTGSNTAAADFTMLQEWTMTAKNAPAEDKAGRVRGGEAKDQGSWYEYTVDLSAYAGQEIWVAIRHFNCNDQFILNVDDITLGDGSEAKAPRNDRTFQSFNLYRRNNVDAASVADPELIVEGTTEFAYTDAAWATLEFGEWQWGIAATYDGYAPVPVNRTRETATFGFEGGSLEGWTGIKVNTDGGEWINSDDNLGGYDYTTLAHSGTGFAMCYSFVDYVGSFDTDAYLVSPQKYSIDASSSIAFWADNANDTYPENFSVCVSTAANPTASDFVQIWNGGAKGTGNGGAIDRRSDNRYGNWRSHEISLAAYAGQEIWIAFHDENYDQYEIWIDDVTITYAGGAPVPPPPGPIGSGISEIIWSNVIDKDMEATLTFNVSLNNGQSPEGATIAVVGENNTYNETVDETGVAEMIVRKGDNYTITVALEGYASYTATEFVEEDEYEYNVVLQEVIAPVAGLYVSPTGWAMWEGNTPGPQPTPPTPDEGQWYFYGDDNQTTGVGAGGAFYWAVMFPAGTYEGNTVTKVANYGAHDDTYGTNGAFTGSVTIYNDGTTVPTTAVGTMDITMPDTDELIEFEFPTPVTIDPTKNLWVVFYNSNSTDYVGSCCNDSGNANGRWVSVDGTSWEDLATAGVPGYNWMIKVYVASGKGEVQEISVPTQVCNNAGALAMVEHNGNRAPISYKVMLDGEYVGESYYPFYQFDVEGMEEGSVHVAQVAPLYTAGMGEWMTYEWTYTSCSNFAGVTDFTSAVDNNTVTLNWTLPGGGSGGSASTFTEGFEGGMPEGWTVVDANNDGYTWCLTSAIPTTWTYYASLTLDWYRTGTNAICSGSYINGAGALNPDEYLIMGQQNIANGSTLSFWAAATDASYPADHFGVAVSDDATSWTMVQEWTLTGKEGAANGGRESRNGNGAKLGTWYNYTVDLSAYAGQKYIAIRHFNCYDQYIMCVDDIELSAGKGVVSSRDMWDLLGTFNAAEGGHYGVVTDGEYIYTSNWGYSSAAHNFYKYDMDGNVIEGFEIPGCGTLRGMTFDGQYVYGVANSSTIYCVDLNNHTLVGTTTSAYGAMRGITYDPARDGFWVIGNWSGNLTLIDRTGAIVQAGPAPTSASDLAYYADPDGVEHVFCFNNGTNDVDDYNIATNTITSAVFNFNSIPGYDGGSSGGCHVATYAGKTAFFGDLQQSPNLIGIYELDGNAPVPPTPVEGIIGAVLFRDGEFVGMFGANTTTYTEELEEAGQYTYTIRVIYDGDPDVTYYAMSCGDDETVTIIDAVEDNDEVISSIYPNPTSGDLYITATAMKHVTVFNTMGQVVFSSDVNTDSYVLNMGQLEAGVYMVKVDAAQGSSVKRIAVVK